MLSSGAGGVEITGVSGTATLDGELDPVLCEVDSEILTTPLRVFEA
jgi:hypothetical protein